MRAVVTLILVLLGHGAVTAAAQEPTRPWVTVLGRDTLSRSGAAVLAKLEKSVIISGRRMSVLHLQVQEVLWGRLEAKKKVNAIQQEPTTPEQIGQQVIVFMRRLRNSWQITNRFFLSGKDGARKLEVLRNHLALEKLPVEKRDAAHRAEILRGVQANLAWEFSVSMGELHKRIIDRGGILEPTFRQKLNRLAFNLRKSSHEKVLRALLALLPAAGRRSPITRTDPIKTPVKGGGEPLTGAEAVGRLNATKDGQVRVLLIHRLTAFPEPVTRRALIRLLGAAPAAERGAAAFALGQMRTHVAAKPLIMRLLGEPDAAAAGAMIRALGLLRTDDGVHAIERRAATPSLFAEVLLALGRIRTPRALKALYELGARETDADRRRLASYYASREFADKDKKRR